MDILPQTRDLDLYTPDLRSRNQQKAALKTLTVTGTMKPISEGKTRKDSKKSPKCIENGSQRNVAPAANSVGAISAET